MVFYASCIMLVLFSLCLGSFCNVLIYRIPKGEQFVSGRSYCPNCNHELAWYDNIPLVSYCLLRGKCRYCGNKISAIYPLIELLVCITGSAVAIYKLHGIDIMSEPYMLIEPFVYTIITLFLVTLSVIDLKTYEIPMMCNVCLLIAGIVITVLEGNYLEHIIGMFSVSLFLFIVFAVTNGRGLGFGDVKLMFACGLICGWKAIVTAFLIGCIVALIVHPIRMKVFKVQSMLAFGPYLSFGVYVSFFIGGFFIDKYISFLNSFM